MIRMLFDLLFVVSLIAPVLAVVAGPIVLLVPTHITRAVTTRRSIRAHA